MTLLLIPILTALAVLALAAALYQLRYRSVGISQRLHRMVDADEAVLMGDASKLEDDGLVDNSIPVYLQTLAVGHHDPHRGAFASARIVPGSRCRHGGGLHRSRDVLAHAPVTPPDGNHSLALRRARPPGDL